MEKQVISALKTLLHTSIGFGFLILSPGRPAGAGAERGRDPGGDRRRAGVDPGRRGRLRGGARRRRDGGPRPRQRGAAPAERSLSCTCSKEEQVQLKLW